MTRKLLFAAMAALAVSSCTQVEVDEVAATQKEPIRFEQFISKATRADDVTNANLTEFRVLVRKYQHETTNDYDITVKKGADGQWTYEDWLFWEAGAKYQFAATNCAKEDGDFKIESTSAEDFSLVCKDFENQISIGSDGGVNEKNIDLVTAIAPVVEGKASGNGTVSFNFKHTMAKVQVTFSIAGYDGYEFDEIAITGIKMGFEDYIADYKQTTDGNFTWTSTDENKGNGAHNYGAINITSPDEPQTRTMFVLPHEIQATDALSFSASFHSTQYETRPFPNVWYNAYLLTDQVQKWEAGKAYNYKVTVRPSEKFKFEVSVDDWSEPQDGTIGDFRDVTTADNAW